MICVTEAALGGSEVIDIIILMISTLGLGCLRKLHQLGIARMCLTQASYEGNFASTSDNGVRGL